MLAALGTVFLLLSAAANAADGDSLESALRGVERGSPGPSLAYLIPRLSQLEPPQLARLEQALSRTRHVSATILVLRHHASRDRRFSTAAARAGEWAFHFGQYSLCRDLLAPRAAELDSASARRFLLSAFYEGGHPESAVIRQAARAGGAEIQWLAALNLALRGEFGAARSMLPASAPPAVRAYVRGLEFKARDKTEEAREQFEQALESPWPEFHAVAVAELFRHYSLTGNRYKAERLWDAVKEDEEGRYEAPGRKEFLARQFALRGHEKQARFLYRGLYNSAVASPAALNALWEELVVDDSTGLRGSIQALLANDSLDCDANILAMRFFKAHGGNREVVLYGRNVALFCPDALEPFLDVGNTLLELRRPVEAKFYFQRYLERGGDRNRVPTYMR